MSTDFAAYYKTITNTELLAILDKPQDYQPAALEAAKAELEKRQLNDAAIFEARKPLQEQMIQQEMQREKIKAVEGKIKSAGAGLFDIINPIQQQKPSVEKTIKRIVVVLGIIYLYQVISGFQLHLATLYDFERSPYTISLYFLPLLLLPVALIFLWNMKQSGWILLAIVLIFSMIDVLWFVFLSGTRVSSMGESFVFTLQEFSPAIYIIRLLFHAGILVLICSKNIRSPLQVDTHKMVAVISISALISFFLVYGAS